MKFGENFQISLIFWIGGCLGDKNSCFSEGNWSETLGIVNGPWYVAKGSSGMCLAVKKPGTSTFGVASSVCSENFENGTLIKNQSWDAVIESRGKHRVLNALINEMLVGCEPKPANQCFVGIINRDAVYLVDNCEDSSANRGFICEYPKQNSCKWEMMTDESATNQIYDTWILKTRLVKFQEADESTIPCKHPNESSVIITADLAKCSSTLFKNVWSQWSPCGLCDSSGQSTARSQFQVVVDKCKHLASGLQRNHTMLCDKCRTESAAEKSERLPIAWIVIGAFCVVLFVLAVVDAVVGIRVWKLWKLDKSSAAGGKVTEMKTQTQVRSASKILTQGRSAAKTRTPDRSASENIVWKSAKGNIDETSHSVTKKATKSKVSKTLKKSAHV